MPESYHFEDQIHNYSMRRTAIDLIVIHSTRSGRTNGPNGIPWTTINEAQTTVQWFINPRSQVSAHLVVDGNGNWYYCVPWEYAAWHAGYLNNRSIGIELCQATPDIPYTDIQIARLVEACRWLCREYGIPRDHLNTEIYSGLIGHDETDQGQAQGKSDPGILFPWDDFITLLQSED